MGDERKEKRKSGITAVGEYEKGEMKCSHQANQLDHNLQLTVTDWNLDDCHKMVIGT